MKKSFSLAILVLMMLSLSACGHKHEMAEKVIKETTCTEHGVIKHYCKTCDFSYEETEGCLPHEYDDGTVVLEKTCESDGKKEYICKSCNKKKEEIIPASHKFNEVIDLEATCKQEGQKTKTCTICGYSKTEKINKLEHGFINDKCVYCDAIKSDINPDSWYHYTDIPYLNCQNCIISNASPLEKSIMVSYYPVCRSCHIVSSLIQLGAPGYNYDVTKNYICPDCGATTRVQLQLSN